MGFWKGRIFRSVLPLMAAAAFSACQAQPSNAIAKASVDYARGQVYVLQQVLFLEQASDTFLGKDLRTWLYLSPPGAGFGNLSDHDAIEKYIENPSEYPEIRGIVSIGTRVEFKSLAPKPNLMPLPFISPANSTDVWLEMRDGKFAGSVVEGSLISDEPNNGVWARVNPVYLSPDKKAGPFPER